MEITPALLFFLRTALTLVFVVPYKFQNAFSISIKNAIGILPGITLNLYVALSSTVILITLIPPAHENRITFHLFLSYLISFINVLQISV